MERNIDRSVFMKKSTEPTTTVETTTPTPVTPSGADFAKIQPIEVVSEDTCIVVPNDTIKEDCNIITLSNINQVFDAGTPNEYQLFKDFSLSIPDFLGKGQMISLMGGSGCGKSCILRVIAGLMPVQSGDISIYCKTPKEYGHIPMVFQQYSNYEWMSVIDNVALPMILKGVPKKEAREKAMDLLKLVGLEEHANKYAKNTTLSGGQLQRISIARCLASGSQIILLDEATGALDIKMKREIQDLLLKIYYDSEFDPTVISVTHSIEEALYISNRIIVLKANPCTIHKVIDIDYNEGVNGRRGPWVFNSPTYAEYTKELTKTLDEVCSTKVK